MRNLGEYILYFFFYSFCGWFYESVLCSIAGKHIVNRGFLNGPICPVYGFGALLIVMCLSPIQDAPVLLLFLAGAVLTCTLEYFTSYLMEKLFHARWWDYSARRFNISGRVCLEGALVFGAFSVAMLRVFHPPVALFVHRINETLLYALSGSLFALLAVDTAVTSGHVLRLNGHLAEIQAALNGYRQSIESQTSALLTQLDGQKNALLGQVEERREYLRGRAEAIWEQVASQFENSPFHSERIQKLLSLRSYQDRRLFHAFPGLNSTRYGEAFKKFRDRALSFKKNSEKDI